jgi:hypothetical protein
VGGVDDWVEQAGRLAAGRLTRRSFLGRVGKVAMMVAGGQAMAVLLAEHAEARVCGQTGVSPRCPTFDCDAIWGWCWYATGCCAGGLLKKICDCCAVDWPNVHGYCPDGTNVKCIVESCGADPRVQTAAISRLPTDDPVRMAEEVRALRWADGAAEVVVTDALVPVVQALATSVASLVIGPVLAIERRVPVDAAVVAEIARLRPRAVRIVGPELPADIDRELAAHGFEVERIGASGDIGRFSDEIAAWIGRRYGPLPAVVAEPEGSSVESLAVVAAFAGVRRYPLIMGVGHGAAGAGSYLVGPGAAERVAEVPGAVPVLPPTWPGVAVELAALAAQADGGAPPWALLAPVGSPMLVALAGLGIPILLHEPYVLDGAREWLWTYGRSLSRVFLAGEAGALGEDTYRELQSLVNGFETDKLTGVGGQGLPIYPQPPPERAVAAARLGTDPPPPRRR